MSMLDYYVTLLEDRRRISAFERAIRTGVRPGDHVVEIGCGVGTYSLFAARAGARRVTAIEREAVAIALARELGVEQLEGGRVRLLHASTQQVRLDEPADVVLFEDLGGFGHHSRLRSLLEYVRSTLARPGARWIPDRVNLVMAPVNLRIRELEPTQPGPLPFPNRALEILRKRSLNDPNARKVLAKHLLADGAPMGELPLSVPIPRRCVYEGTTRATRDGAVTAVVGWMNVVLAETELLTNSPFEDRLSWELMLFPFETPITVAVGDLLLLRVEAVYGPGPDMLLWRWSVESPRESAQGCSANAIPGDPVLLRHGSEEDIPHPTSLAGAVARICQQVDGKLAASEIAKRLYNEFRPLFPDEDAATDLVLEVLNRLRGVSLK